jgi:uncharacterized radical SAM protein YgiQ
MNPKNTRLPLPMSREEMKKRGWNQCDIILVSGDAYVDHPTFGIALIGRWLEQHGFRVGVIAQPDWHKKDDFMLLGRPRLFFGVSAGNVDSMVANYTSMKHRRHEDDYAPGRRGGLRPDRAVTVYARGIRQAYGEEAVIVLGGIEASLRRLAHYDFWDDRVHPSILVDSTAQILVYGMGERAALEIAQRLDKGLAIGDIRGTAILTKDLPKSGKILKTPSFEQIADSKTSFNEAFLLSRQQMEPTAGLTLVQPHGKQMVVVNPPAMPLKPDEMDSLYDLPYTRSWHPRYESEGGIRALETVRFSVTSHRGCCGECSFCALFFHQGRIVSSRSQVSIIKEVKTLAEQPGFRGTITDIGGPSANLHGAMCEKWKQGRFCQDRSCLTPEPCPRLKLDYPGLIRLYKAAMAVPRVKHVFVGSGLRYDLLLGPESDALLTQICSHQISGILKIAPEHSDPRVLDLMNKPRFDRYELFYERFKRTVAAVGKKSHIVNYLITDHPGTTLQASFRLAGYLRRHHMSPEQVQDFLPSPMTRSTAMYHTGRDPLTRQEVEVTRVLRERRLHRALLQPELLAHRNLADEALRRIHSQEPDQPSHPRRGTQSAAHSRKRKKT